MYYKISYYMDIKYFNYYNLFNVDLKYIFFKYCDFFLLINIKEIIIDLRLNILLRCIILNLWKKI